jgi:hypothetical protein
MHLPDFESIRYGHCHIAGTMWSRSIPYEVLGKVIIAERFPLRSMLKLDWKNSPNGTADET